MNLQQKATYMQNHHEKKFVFCFCIYFMCGFIMLDKLCGYTYNLFLLDVIAGFSTLFALFLELITIQVVVKKGD